MNNKHDIVIRSFDSCFDFVVEYSLVMIDNNENLDSISKAEIFRKVVEIREHLEYCEKIWKEVQKI